jgi:hypothetical protein
MTIEFTDFRRPARLASATRMAGMEIVGELAFEPVAGASRMRWHWTLRPHGALRAARPLIAWLGNRQERRIWSALKRHLEAEGELRSGPAESDG